MACMLESGYKGSAKGKGFSLMQQRILRTMDLKRRVRRRQMMNSLTDIYLSVEAVLVDNRLMSGGVWL